MCVRMSMGGGGGRRRHMTRATEGRMDRRRKRSRACGPMKNDAFSPCRRARVFGEPEPVPVPAQMPGRQRAQVCVCVCVCVRVRVCVYREPSAVGIATIGIV
jgi:hypothetical protein